MNTNIFILAAVSALLGSAAAAQVSAFDNRGSAEDAVDDLEEQIEDDRERDIRISNDGRTIGTYGSMAFRLNSTTNDGETGTDVGAGLRYGWFDGLNGVDMNLSYVYGEDDGDQTDNRLLAGLDYRRDLSPRFFAYGQADISLDRLSDEPGEYEQDIFVGAGLGYRLVSNSNFQWSVQAGPGYRLAELVGGDEVSESAASVSSNIYYSLSDTTYITNDTDVIYSDYATTLSNDLAVNISMTDTLSLRASYATRFNDQTDDDFQDGENTLGVSVVYNFQ